MKVFVMHGSSREGGNTELLARRVVEGLDATHVRLREFQIGPIVDQRHAPGGFTFVADDQDRLIRQMLAHDVLLFATPLYWYGMSGCMKDFIDRWTQNLRDPDLGFKDGIRGKQAYVVVTGGADARLKGLPLILQFRHIFDFVGVDFAGYLIGTGGRPGQILEDDRALLEADALNRALRRQAQ